MIPVETGPTYIPLASKKHTHTHTHTHSFPFSSSLIESALRLEGYSGHEGKGEWNDDGFGLSDISIRKRYNWTRGSIVEEEYVDTEPERERERERDNERAEVRANRLHERNVGLVERDTYRRYR